MIKEMFKDFPIPTEMVYDAWPKRLLQQRRDWTCAYACVSTLLAEVVRNVPTEEQLIMDYTPRPIYAKKLCELETLNDVFSYERGSEMCIAKALSILKTGSPIMALISAVGPHWVVLLNVYTTKVEADNADQYMCIYYDPYYDRCVQMVYDEFLSEWNLPNKHKFEFAYVSNVKKALEVWE